MLEAKDITYAYGKKSVLRGVSLTARGGQCIGIAGANGCGKSTFLSILSGAFKPQGGQCLFDGKDAFANRKLFARYVGYVPQDNALIDELSVMDNLKLWYGGTGQVKQAISTGFLSVLGLEKQLSETIKNLSGGQKKRVSLGCAMASEPPILVMDEPGAALDLICKEEIRRYLKLYLNHQGTIIMATHEEAELDLCSQLFIMCDGRLVSVSPALRGTQLVDALMKYTTEDEYDGRREQE